MMDVGCESKGDMRAMMSQMMEGCGPQMITEMMPHCVGMMVQKVPKEKRTEFVSKMVSIFAEQGATGLSEQEKKEFLAKLVASIKA